MTTIDRQLAVQLQTIVDNYELTMEVDTGDEEGDEQYRHGVQSVLADIKSLLNDLGDGFNIYNSEKPFIPTGFKLHAVLH